MTQRIHRLEGVRNFRDFGNYPSRHGGRVASGRLYRSGHYNDAKPDDLAFIEGLNIQLQADLRRPDERDRQPGKWQAPDVIFHDGGRETVAPHERFLSRIGAGAESAEAWMVGYYKEAPFKPHHAEMFRDWFLKLVDLPDGSAAVVNCAAGKDRTGMLCALTHHVLGVADEDIAEDYILTNTAVDIENVLAEAAKYWNNMLDRDHHPDTYRPFLGVRPNYLETAFEAIRAEAGSIDAYITDALGVPVSVQDRLREQLLTG